MDEPTTFDLQVKVNLRGTTTAGVLVQFESKFYLSTDSHWDDQDEEVRQKHSEVIK